MLIYEILSRDLGCPITLADNITLCLNDLHNTECQLQNIFLL